jgi:very-short-patch-repair endonuclease
MWFIPYNKSLKEFSRKLRNNSTKGEILLWMRLRAASMRGYTFNRQKPLNRYIVDFYCKPLRLVIEIDGMYHFAPEQMVKDKERQIILELEGLNFLRFTEQQVRRDMEMVLAVIGKYVDNFESNQRS